MLIENNRFWVEVEDLDRPAQTPDLNSINTFGMNWDVNCEPQISTFTSLMLFSLNVNKSLQEASQQERTLLEHVDGFRMRCSVITFGCNAQLSTNFWTWSVQWQECYVSFFFITANITPNETDYSHSINKLHCDLSSKVSWRSCFAQWAFQLSYMFCNIFLDQAQNVGESFQTHETSYNPKV